MFISSIQCLLELAEGEAQQGLQITDEPIHVSLVGGLLDDVLVVVVTKPTAELLVVHGGLAFSLAPATSDFWRVDNLELPVPLVGPLDARLALSVGQQFQQELPQLDL